MRLPDFLIIGAAKSGTTTLYHYLCRHPNVFMSTPKEPEFFARDDRWAKGMDWYASLFADAREDQLVGEGSTKYTRWPQYPDAAERIRQTIPDVKMICVFREPVARAYSHYVQRMKTGQNTKQIREVALDFDEAVRQMPDLVDGSDYVAQVQQYFDRFPRESILFMLFERMVDDMADHLRRVQRFLGIDESVDLMDDGEIVSNVASSHVETYTRTELTRRLKRIPGVDAIKDALPQSVRDGVYDLVSKTPYGKSVQRKISCPPMPAETRKMLHERFVPDRDKLAELTGLDLSPWNGTES